MSNLPVTPSPTHPVPSHAYLITIDGQTFVRSGMPAVLLDDAHGWHGLAASPALKAEEPDQQDTDEEELSAALLLALAAASTLVVSRITQGVPVSDAEITGAMAGTLQTELARIATERAVALGVENAIAIDSAEISRLATEWARTYSYELVKDLTATTRGVIADAVSAWTANPAMTQADVAKLLEPAFGKVRAGLIGSTETARAWEAGIGLYKRQIEEKYGLTMIRYWLTRDGACAICAPLDGKAEQHWGSYSGGPPLHPRCRCRTAVLRIRVTKE